MQRQPPNNQNSYPPYGERVPYNYLPYGQQPAAPQQHPQPPQAQWAAYHQPAGYHPASGYHPTGYQPAAGFHPAYQPAASAHQPAAGYAPAGYNSAVPSHHGMMPSPINGGATSHVGSPASPIGGAPGSLTGDAAILARLKVDFPDIQEKTLATAVRTRKTYHDALRWLRQMQQQNLMPAQQHHDAQRRSIRQKFTQINNTPDLQQFVYQGVPGQGPMMAQRPVVARVPPRKNFDEDDSASDESDSDAYDPAEAAEFDARLLQFLNTASADAIADVAAQPMESVEALVKKRPYVTLAQAAKVDVPGVSSVPVDANGKRRRGAARKPAGSKIIDAARTTLRGYEAVDSLIKECARVGKQVQRRIAAWGLDEDKLTPQNTGTGFFTEQPKLLSEGTQLKNYQQVGINWLSLLYSQRLSCILADEMGLGKTLQVIAFLAHLKEIGEPGPHLVVCPASTLENWLREFARFCPSLVVEPYYGSMPERAEIREALLARGNSFEVLVTTYNLATGGKQDMGFLKSLGFNVCIYDEGHLLKNSQSERYNKLMRLRANFRVLLTGTPLQNNLKELVSLLSFILPKLFEQNRDDLLEVFRFKAKATSDESERSRDDLLSEQRIRKAKTMMQPFVLRRRKEQVLAHLPPKSHEVIHCAMTEPQRKIYEREVKRNKKGLQTAKEHVDEKPATKKGQREAGKQLDNVLMQLRKAALHPLLFREVYTDAKLRKMAKAIMDEDQYKNANEQYIFEDMQVMNDFELDRLCRQFPVTLGEYVLGNEAYLESGKVEKLVELLKAMSKAGDRILLFSQFTQVLDILQRVLDTLGLKFLRIDGQTPVEMRQDLIDQYYENEEISVFLLSTKAGGFGINLAVANVVIIFDLSFNPHDDKQAEDRAHRVGQTRPVRVVRMITKDTIEENILQLANTKLALDKQVSEDMGEDEDEIDAEKEAYVAGQLLDGAPTEDNSPLVTPSAAVSAAASDSELSDDDDDVSEVDDEEAPAAKRVKSAPRTRRTRARRGGKPEEEDGDED